MTHKNDLNFNAKLNGKEKFGFRKLSAGLAAVALGTTFFLSSGQLVHADETTAGQQPTTEVKEAAQDSTAETKVADTNDGSKATDTTQTETPAAAPTSSETNSTDNTQESTSNNKKDEETTTLNTASLETKDDSSKVAASLTESKITTDQPSYSSTVTATKKNDGTNLTQTTTKNNPATLGSDQDTVQVDTTVDLNNVRSVTHDNPITIQIVNGDTGSTDPLMTNDRINGNNSWHFEKRTDMDNAFNAWYTGSNLPTSVTFSVNVLANNSKVKDYLANNPGKTGEDVPVGVKITYPTGNSETKTAFYAHYVPTQDRVSSGEILQGFQMVTTTVGSERQWNNISNEDYNNNHLDNSDTVYQWGFYFNYGNNLNPNDILTLMNAQFSATFHNQTFLPSSIKVFEVPTDLVSDGHGNRYGINDTPSGKTNNIYSTITAWAPGATSSQYERKAFEDYLQNHSNQNGFSVDQSNDGTFHVQNDTSYSKHAYFIQVDTAVKNPENAPVWLEIYSNGNGTTSNHTVVWQNNSGNGSDTQKQQQAVIRFYDDETQQYLDVDSSFDNQAIYANGPAGNWINFGDEALATFNNYDKKNYVYSRVTVGDNVKSSDTILGSDGKPAGFAVTGIFPKFDDINDRTDGTDSHPQYFVVHFTHKRQAAESQSTTVTEHVSYYYENGSKQGQAVPSQYAPINQELHFTRDGVTDLVTGNTTYSNWKLVDANGNEISLPAISFSQLPQTLDENYKLDANGTFNIVTNNTGKQLLIIKGNNGSIQAIPLSDDDITALYNQNGGLITIQVPYAQASTPTPIAPPTTPKPDNSTPKTDPSEPSDTPTPVTPLPTVEPTAPAQPTDAPILPDVAPAHPAEAKKVIGHNHKSNTNIAPHSQTPKQKHGHDYNYTATPKAAAIHTDKSTVQPKSQVKTVISKTTNKVANDKKNTLPQTGENKSNLGLLGLGFVAVASLLGLAIDRKRKN